MSLAFHSSEWNSRGSSFAINNWRMHVCPVEQPTGFRKTQVEVNIEQLTQVLVKYYNQNQWQSLKDFAGIKSLPFVAHCAFGNFRRSL